MYLLVINQFASTPKYSSGAGERFYYLAPFFKKNGIKTRVISAGYNHLFIQKPSTPKLFNDEEVNGGLFTWVKVRKYKKDSFIGRFISWIEFFLKLFILKHKNRPDVVIVSSMSLLPIIYAFWLNLIFRSKVILEVRDIWPLTPMELGGYSVRNPFIFIMSVIEKWAYRGADVLVSVLPDFSKHVLNVIGEEKQVFWIPNAIPFSTFDWTKEKCIRREKSPFLVIYAGAIGIANAMNVVIEAANSLKENKNIMFKIIGDGPEKQNLINQAKKLKLHNIEFIGKMPKNDVARYLRNADAAFISWQNSKLYEFGVSANKYNDYMMAGIPIISLSNFASDPVLKSNCGYQVNSGDSKAFVEKILELKEKPFSELAEIGARGRNFVMEYQTYSKISKSYVSIIKKLIEA